MHKFARHGAKTWLELKKEGLTVHDDANGLFSEEAGLVNVVACMGDLRSGKSYLMNALAKRKVFGVSAQARSYTKGVHISPSFAENIKYDDRPKVAYADMEGQKDQGMSYDVKLATPVLLVSKVVFLNVVCPGGPSKVGILETLAILMNAAKQVTKPKDRKNLFGNLHIVLRDCMQNERECFDIIFGLEDDSEADTDDQADAIKKRNDVRGAIKASFESLPRVWCLPKLAGDAPANYADAPEPFVSKIDEIRAAVTLQLASPKTLGGTPLTGKMIALMMPALKEKLNSDDPALNPPTLMQAVFDAEVKRLKAKYTKLFKAALKVIEAELPMNAAEMWQRAEQALQTMLLDATLRDFSVATSKSAEGWLLEWIEPALYMALEEKNGKLLARRHAVIEKAAKEEAKRNEATAKKA